jgi:hypothetical protein
MSMDADIEYGFETALKELKAGACVAREGWNGKGMFVWLEKGSSPQPIDDEDRASETINRVGAEHFEQGAAGTVTRMPHLCLRAADGSIVTGWLASQTDMLAEDWVLVTRN